MKRTAFITVLGLVAVLSVSQWLEVRATSPDLPKPKRINKVIELFEQGQPVYYVGSGAGGYEDGVKLAQTWADYINYGMEHAPFDLPKLKEFMRGLADGGPTKSGHRTPTVIHSFCHERLLMPATQLYLSLFGVSPLPAHC